MPRQAAYQEMWLRYVLEACIAGSEMPWQDVASMDESQ
jgi:hypothetical protein